MKVTHCISIIMYPLFVSCHKKDNGLIFTTCHSKKLRELCDLLSS